MTNLGDHFNLRFGDLLGEPVVFFFACAVLYALEALTVIHTFCFD